MLGLVKEAVGFVLWFFFTEKHPEDYGYSDDPLFVDDNPGVRVAERA